MTNLNDVRKQGVKFGQLEFVDINGILRGKITAPEELEEGSTASTLLLTANSNDEVVVTPLACFESGFLKSPILPDSSTLRVLPWRESVASVICDFTEDDGAPHALNPRTILKDAMEKLALHGYEAKVGLEMEFYLYYEDLDAIREGRYRDLKKFGLDRHAYSLNRIPNYQTFATELMGRMADIGIHLETFHTEYGVGMYECTTSPCAPLEAADGWVRLKAYLRELCSEYGLVTSFMPVLALDVTDTSLGAHQNISIWKDGKNALWDEKNQKLSEVGNHFAGGLVNAMQDFHLFFRPWVNSYRRFDPLAFCPTTVSWGMDNHFASMRILHGHRPEKTTRLEHRISGMDCNIYLTLASLVLSGLHGVENEIALPEPIDGKMPGEFGVPELSNSLPAAIKNFRESKLTKELMGAGFVEHYALLKDAEWEAFETWAKESNEGNTEHNDLNVTQWEYDQYFGWI